MTLSIKKYIKEFTWLIYLCCAIDILPLPIQWERFEFVFLFLPTSILYMWAQGFETYKK